MEELVRKHAKGEVAVPTELEKIMLEEAEELIRHKYDHKAGARELYRLLQAAKDKDGRTKKGKNLLVLTNFDKKIKLKQMVRTWGFTRPWSMMFKLIETWFYMIVSNTQNLIYLCMIFSMFENAGLISLVYPVAVFGYALLEETRPRKEFWNFARLYTTVLLFFKFLVNLSVFGDFMSQPAFLEVTGYLKPGIYDFDSLPRLVVYMLPEILIICFIMLNEIHLKLIGLFYDIEQDIETINDGIQRNIEEGDEEKVKQKKI